MGEVLYSDNCVSLDTDGVTIRRYYFPLGSEKRIRYGDVRGVVIESMNWLTGKGRLWGTADPRAWLPLDWQRPWKDKLLIFDVGERVKPCVSPDDADRVIELLRTRVAVS
jgi:hypothetical protein